MLARISNALHLTNGQKAVSAAYCAVMAVSAGITFMLMTKISGTTAGSADVSQYGNWIILAGGLASGLALYMARGWLGGHGALGFARATVAVVVVTLVTAIIAGTLVSPFYGTLVGPFVLIAEFIAAPLLAICWAAVLFGAHFLIGMWKDEQMSPDGVGRRTAVSQLSSLSRANLYSNR